MSSVRCDILVVDDDPSLRRLLSMRLQAGGYKVETANSGEAALVSLAASWPRLVITDMCMGGMNGMALFDALQLRQPGLPVIILTAHGTIPSAIEATRSGVFGFLSKPFDSKELLQQVRSALELSAPDSVDTNADNDWRSHIVTRSPVLEEILRETWLVAQSEASIFITGDSGTGKELLAQAVHRASPRRQQPFVAVNCGAIPTELLESELFGHSKGAFTGATEAREGLFQAAHKGTLFLDEIGDMPLILQAKLLRALQERQIRPVGANRSLAVDVRVVSATHYHLEEQVETGEFREDLYYRLNVVTLSLPPLRERREDIPLLAKHFMKLLVSRDRRSVNAFAPAALELLGGADWPGNVRQLYNVVEYCIALSTTPVIPAALVKKALRDRVDGILPLAEARSRFERDYLVQVLHLTAGNVTQAARLAKRNRTDFYKLLNRHQIDPALFKDKD